jgi:hypothetical protein
MGDKEFHEMLGILFDHDDLIVQVTSQSSQSGRERALRNLATERNIDLGNQDVTDLLNAVDGIHEAKNKESKHVFRSPRH